ncbi:unnamed protein product [Lactuca virosa]|uniref:Uncharacterized protein n=1 Tax=Lactuca virosa TaxID=75947 RepID=A0AAU9M6I9_9ASTR|nr:unnamed protein product [Lactuca virosa]
MVTGSRKPAHHEVKKCVHEFNDKDKLLVALDVKARESLIIKLYISRSEKKPSGLRKFPSKIDSSASKTYDDGWKIVVENKGQKYFNYGGTDRFARECKPRKLDRREDYEEKYEKLLASLKRQNIDVKILVAEVENWVDDEKSSNEDQEKFKCFMAHINALVADE